MAAANVLGDGVGYVYLILMARRLDARYLGIYTRFWLRRPCWSNCFRTSVSNEFLIREIASSGAAAGQGLFLTALPFRLATSRCLCGGRPGRYCFIYLKGIVAVRAAYYACLFLSAIYRGWASQGFRGIFDRPRTASASDHFATEREDRNPGRGTPAGIRPSEF